MVETITFILNHSIIYFNEKNFLHVMLFNLNIIDKKPINSYFSLILGNIFLCDKSNFSLIFDGQKMSKALKQIKFLKKIN